MAKLKIVGMQNFQDTFETHKRSFISVFSNLHDRIFNVLMSLNVGDFMKLQKEGKFHHEKLYFRIKHHIYTNAKECLN